MMRVLILSAGHGTRLGVLTRKVPKAMLDVHGRPILELIVSHLVSCGLREIAINLHFEPDAIRTHFGDGSAFGVRIEYSYESDLLGTAGAAKSLAAFLALDPEFMVHYGDVVTTHDFSGMLGFHRSHAGTATMLVHERRESNSVVESTADGRVVRFLERPSPEERADVVSPWAYSGVCIFNRCVLNDIPDGVADLPRDVFPELVRRGELYAQPLDGFRCAVDSPTRLELLRDAVTSGLASAR